MDKNILGDFLKFRDNLDYFKLTSIENESSFCILHETLGMKSYLFVFSHALTLGLCLTLQYRIFTVITSACSIMVNVLITLLMILVAVRAISHGKNLAENGCWKESFLSEETFKSASVSVALCINYYNHNLSSLELWMFFKSQLHSSP